MTWLPPQYAKKQVLKLRLGTYVTPHPLRVFDKILSGWQKLWSRWRRKNSWQRRNLQVQVSGKILKSGP